MTTPIGTGFHVGQRAAAQGARPLRQPAAGANCRAVPSRFEGVDLVDRAREHRGPLQRARARGRSRSRREPQDHHRARLDCASPASPSSTPRKHGRKRITAVHKANIMKLSDGLFLDCFREVAAGYPDDPGRRPHHRQPLHAAGDAPRDSSTCCCSRTSTATSSRISRRGWWAGSASSRERTSARKCAVFEAVHGSAPDIAGQGRRQSRWR